VSAQTRCDLETVVYHAHRQAVEMAAYCCQARYRSRAEDVDDTEEDLWLSRSMAFLCFWIAGATDLVGKAEDAAWSLLYTLHGFP